MDEGAARVNHALSGTGGVTARPSAKQRGGEPGAAWMGWCLAALVMAGGCERWPWEAPKDSGKASAQQPAAAPQGPVPSGVSVPETERIALVNQTPISTTDAELATLELKRFMQAYQQPWKPLSVEDLPDALDLPDVMNSLVEAELKEQDVLARGLNQKPELKRRLTYVQRSFYAQEWDRWQRERGEPSEEEVHQFYEQNKTGFTEPERVRLRQIVTDTVADAEAVRSQAVQGTPFAQLARDKSVGAGKEQGGEVGWYLRAIDAERLRILGKLTDQEKVCFPQLESVAFALEAGQVSQPVKGPEGRYYVVQLDERKPSRQQTELEVHDAIKELLTIQNVQRRLEDLRTKAKIERFPERLKDVSQ